MARTPDKSARDEVADFLDQNTLYEPKSLEEAIITIDAYSDRLRFLWEQYIKVVQLNIVLAGATIGLIANLSLLRSSTNDLIGLDWLQASLVLAGISGLGALVWRFCAQVQMERQVYGNVKVARWYFRINASEEPQGLSARVRRYEVAAFWLKLASGGFLLFSWGALFAFAYQNLGASAS